MDRQNATRLTALLASLGLVAAFSTGCNAVEGLGEDLQQGSSNVQEAIDPNESDPVDPDEIEVQRNYENDLEPADPAEIQPVPPADQEPFPPRDPNL